MDKHLAEGAAGLAHTAAKPPAPPANPTDGSQGDHAHGSGVAGEPNLDALRSLMAQAAATADSAAAQSHGRIPEPLEEKARRWLVKATSTRPLTEAEAAEKLTTWLEKRDLDTQIVPQAIAWGKAEGFLNDAAFAQLWIENRGVKRGYGRRRLTQELRKRKIAEHHIDAALGQLDDLDEYEQARALAGQRHLRYNPEEDPRRVASKLVNFLIRRGFESAIAHRAALAVTRANEDWD